MAVAVAVAVARRWRQRHHHCHYFVVGWSLVSFLISNESSSMIGFWGEQRGGFVATPRHFSTKLV